MATWRLLLPLLLVLLAHTPRCADGFAGRRGPVEGRPAPLRFKRESPKVDTSFENIGKQIHSLLSSLPSLGKPSFDDIEKLGERFASLGHGTYHRGSFLATSSDGEGVLSHEEVSGETGSSPHRTSGTYFFDRKGGLSGFSCYDEKCKKERLKERRRRAAADRNGYLTGKAVQSELLNNVLNTLQALSMKLQELQNRLAQTLQSATAFPVHHPAGSPPTVHVPDSSSSQFSGAAAGGSIITAGGGSPVQGEFHGSSISSSTSPGGGTIVSHKEVVDRLGSPAHTSSGSYLVNPQGEVSGVSCTDGKCHKVGDKSGGQASGPPPAAATVPLADRGGLPSVNRPETHYSSTSFAVDPAGHVSGVSCVDGKCKTTRDNGRDRRQ
ncbi:uncharacterized protein LOC126280330 [Schistocerca gregaria]|uniref:uncharacterized protein LOC126280330 n=1 Tax=Schistocerca gregaria TaxID=7010 RepID=UPI00211F1799|nr:uncharacterized protein LOC126280330 [Schistocerca gregaria]